MKYFRDSIFHNRMLLIKSLVGAFFWGLLAHGYMFLHNSISHDSFNEFISKQSVIDWKLQLGRVFVPAYQYIVRGFITIPWLVGLLSIFCLGCAVFLFVKIFNIHSNLMIILISGVFTVNLTVISLTATYIHDMDADMLALFLAVLAVFLWKRCRYGYLYGSIPLMFCLGLYQSYISVTITIVIMVLIFDLLKGQDLKRVFIKGIKSVGMILVAGILYFVVMKSILFFADVSIVTNNYNSIDTILRMNYKEIIYAIFATPYYTIWKIISPASVFPEKFVILSNVCMILFAAFVVLKRVLGKQLGFKEKVLTLVLIALLPLGMNICEVMTGGMSHYLMYFSIWIAYIFILLLVDFDVEQKKSYVCNFNKWICVGLVVIMLIGNVRFANTAYLIKDFAQDANLSLFTRVATQMEDCEDYVWGETPVVFVGNPGKLLQVLPETENIHQITGMGSASVIGVAEPSRYERYFEYVLQMPIEIASQEIWDEMSKSKIVQDMPIYPNQDAIRMIDGVLVVKLSSVK